METDDIAYIERFPASEVPTLHPPISDPSYLRPHSLLNRSSFENDENCLGCDRVDIKKVVLSVKHLFLFSQVVYDLLIIILSTSCVIVYYLSTF